MIDPNTLSEQQQVDAVHANPSVIKHIANPSCRVQMSAVTRMAAVIVHIDNPCEQVRDFIVRHRPTFISYVDDNGTRSDLQILAAEYNHDCTVYISNPSWELLEYLWKNCPSVLQDVEDRKFRGFGGIPYSDAVQAQIRFLNSMEHPTK
jgi:hypothetical protein